MSRDDKQAGIGSALLSVTLVREAESGIPTGTVSAIGWTQTTYDDMTVTWTSTVTNHDNWLLEPYVNGIADRAPFVLPASATIMGITRSDYPWPLPSPTGTTPKMFWRIWGRNGAGDTATKWDSSKAEVLSAPSQIAPLPVTNLSATVLAPSRVRLNWTPAVYDGNGEWKTEILYSLTSGQEAAVRINLGVDMARDSAIIQGLRSGQDYYFWVVNSRWGKTASTQTTATTPAEDSTVSTVSGLTLTPGAMISEVVVANAIMVFSSRDRAAIYNNRRWYPAGLKPFKDWGTGAAKPTIEVTGTGDLSGEFTPYVVYFRNGSPSARSLPVAGDTTVRLNNVSIRLKPPIVTGAVPIREYGYDVSGAKIPAADYYELYLGEETLGRAYLVARLPVDDTVGSAPINLTLDQLADGTRRPMEILEENRVPPICGRARLKDGRIWAFYEETFAGEGTITVTAGSRVATISGYTADGSVAEGNDRVLYHELWIGRQATGWVATDVDGNEILLSHGDPVINEAGWNLDLVGGFTDYNWVASNRVYTSGYYNGESGGGVTFNPQGFPPLCAFEGEFDPNDGERCVGIEASRDSLFVFKESKVFLVNGGVEPVYGDPVLGSVVPSIQVAAISRTSGLLAPNTICRDRSDLIWYLSDQGLHRVDQSGVEQVCLKTGGAWQFQQYFDKESVRSAVGCWLAREEYFVAAGLTRKGDTQPNSGFIFDSRNGVFLYFNTPFIISRLTPIKSPSGEGAVLYGDTTGNVGAFLVPDWYTDGFDWRSGGSIETPIQCWIRSAVKPTAGTKTPTIVRPRLIQEPLVDAIEMTLGVDGKRRSDNAQEFLADSTVTWMSSDWFDRLRMAPVRAQSHSYKLSWESKRNERIMFQGIEIEEDVMGRG